MLPPSPSLSSTRTKLRMNSKLSTSSRWAISKADLKEAKARWVVDLDPIVKMVRSAVLLSVKMERSADLLLVKMAKSASDLLLVKERWEVSSLSTD